MIKITQKTLEDLEFPVVVHAVEARCNTEKGKQLAKTLSPIPTTELLFQELGRTSEYLSSFENENRIPNHGFEAIDKELRLLAIENAIIEIGGFSKISGICTTMVLHHKFFKKFKDYYPLLCQFSEQFESTPWIPDQISEVIDNFGLIRDSASVDLKQIRISIQQVRAKINQSFGGALSRYTSADFLDEIRESVVDNRRVLAVKAMYRRKVKGTVMGSSKTGSIVYIVPEATLQYTNELSNLEHDEQEEIRKILLNLTNAIRPYGHGLQLQQTFLAQIDLTAAKAKYASELGALLPEINTNRRLYLRDAYHPLLYLSNKQKGVQTWPQTIELNDDNRIIVISGPNAGGKSITLKTIGLLQVMLQSGLLVPVHERSTFCFFDTVLSDIGDNQSIENHLSTYSYRLKNMNKFLKRCNAKTLFLIDEFGTGSDPELGGALAEAFLEVFYERKAYGIITTHYANLKLLANELPNMSNANMQFNNQTLEPTYKLVLGEAGSSFTFEVAQKNGIPFGLINKAKKKIDRGKVRFDATISKLQKERNKMSQTEMRLQEEETKARENTEKLEVLNQKIKSKLESYQELYDHNSRMILLGNKLNKLAEQYFVDNKKRSLISGILQIVETENSKRKRLNAEELRRKQLENQKVSLELEKRINQVREEKKAKAKTKVKEQQNKPKPELGVGDQVRLADGKSVGTIDNIEKGKALVNYGIFTTKVDISKLELVKKVKT